MIAATTSEAIASPCWKPSATAVMPPRTATEPAMSPAKWKALERSAADLYFFALRRLIVTRLRSTTRAMAMTAKTYQRGSKPESPPLERRSIASITTKAPPPERIAASPSAARFSARRCP